MLDKIDELFILIDAGDYHGAYEKLLRDIKPKLTGLKTDENEQPFDNGIMKHPWVIDALYQATFRSGCNLILQELKNLDPILSLVNQIKMQCNIASWDKKSHKQAMLDKINQLVQLIDAGEYQDASDLL